MIVKVYSMCQEELKIKVVLVGKWKNYTHIMIPFNFLYRWISFYDTFQIYIRTFG